MNIETPSQSEASRQAPGSEKESRYRRLCRPSRSPRPHPRFGEGDCAGAAEIPSGIPDTFGTAPETDLVNLAWVLLTGSGASG